MLGPFKNSAIEHSFGDLEEVPNRQQQLFIIGWLVEHAHDLTQEQLNHIVSKLINPFKLKKGTPKKTKRHWEIINYLRKKYDKDKVILSYSEVIDFIKFLTKNDNISTANAYRAIYIQIKDFVHHYPATKGRPKNSKKSR